jgi:hypothetical protein
MGDGHWAPQKVGILGRRLQCNRTRLGPQLKCGCLAFFRTSLDVEKREKALIYGAFGAVNATELDLRRSLWKG